MMELIERAIPVIQHLPEARSLAESTPVRRNESPARGLASSEAPSVPSPQPRRSRDSERRDVEVALSGVHAVLERLHIQQAQLTSGAVLQQYQRQVAFEVEDSRPATKVLSVQG